MTHLSPHRRVCAWIIALAMVIGVLPARLSLGADFTWSDQFEGDPRGAAPTNTEWWTASAGVVVSNQSATTWGSNPSPLTGTNIVYVPQDASLTNTPTDVTTATNVWVDMYIQPNLYDGTWSNREVDASAAALFFFDEASSNVVVHNGSVTNWEKIAKSVGGTDVTVSESGQTRVTVYMDYVHDTWSLFLNGTLMKDQIAFVSSKSAMNNIVISDDAYVDNVWISTTNYPDGSGTQPALLDDDGEPCDEDRDGMGDAWEIAYFGSITNSEGRVTDNKDGDSRTDLEEYVDGTDPTTPSEVAWLIPYYEKFLGAEAGVMGDRFRAITKLSGAPTVTETKALSLQSMSDYKAISLADNAGMQVTVTNRAGTNVFVQVYVKPVACEAVPEGVADGESAAICVVGDTLYVYTNDQWGATSLSTNALTNGAWVGLAAHMDYLNDQWDLYYTLSGDFQKQMTKLNSQPMDFGTSQSGAGKFESLTITNESTSTTYVDAVAVSLSYTPLDANYTNLVIFERLQNAINPTDLPPYDYDEGALLQGSAFGKDIAIGLASGDVIQGYTGNVWTAYYLSTNRTWTYQSGDINPDWSTMQGIEISRKPGYDALAFYPFDQSLTPDNTVTQTVHSLDDSSFHGRSRLSVPSTLLTCVDVNDLQFSDPGPHKDDMLIFYLLSQESSMIFTRDDNNTSWITKSPLGPDHFVCPGEGFTYFRASNNSLEFIIAQ